MIPYPECEHCRGTGSMGDDEDGAIPCWCVTPGACRFHGNDLPCSVCGASFWVPEHPSSSLALYRAREPIREGKLSELTRLVTTDIHAALQFATREECEAWIEANPRPAFVAREHAVMSAPRGGR